MKKIKSNKSLRLDLETVRPLRSTVLSGVRGAKADDGTTSTYPVCRSFYPCPSGGCTAGIYCTSSEDFACTVEP